MSSEMIKIDVWASCGFVQGNLKDVFEMEREVWESASDEEKDDWIFEFVCNSGFEWGYSER